MSQEEEQELPPEQEQEQEQERADPEEGTELVLPQGTSLEDLVREFQARLRASEEREAELLVAAEIGQALLEENQQLKEQSKQVEEENKSLLEKNQQLEQRCTTLDQLRIFSEEQAAKLGEEAEAMEAQLKSIRNELRASAQIAAQFKALQLELDSYKEEVRVVKESEEATKRSNNQLAAELKKLEREIQSNTSSDVQINALKSQLEKLQSAEAAREKLQDSLARLVEENEEMKRAAEEKDKLVKLVNSLVLANKHLQEDQEEYKMLLQGSRQKIEALQAKLGDLELQQAKNEGTQKSGDSIFTELASMLSPAASSKRKPAPEQKTESTAQLPDSPILAPPPRSTTTALSRRRRAMSTIETNSLLSVEMLSPAPASKPSSLDLPSALHLPPPSTPTHSVVNAQSSSRAPVTLHVTSHPQHDHPLSSPISEKKAQVQVQETRTVAEPPQLSPKLPLRHSSGEICDHELPTVSHRLEDAAIPGQHDLQHSGPALVPLQPLSLDLPSTPASPLSSPPLLDSTPAPDLPASSVVAKHIAEAPFSLPIDESGGPLSSTSLSAAPTPLSVEPQQQLATPSARADDSLAWVTEEKPQQNNPVVIANAPSSPAADLDILATPLTLSVTSDRLFDFSPTPVRRDDAKNETTVSPDPKIVEMEMRSQQLESEIERWRQREAQRKEHEGQLLASVLELRERLSASYLTLMSPQMKSLVASSELLAISDTVIDSVTIETKQLLAYEGERKLFGSAEEMACQVLELLLDFTELAKKLNSTLRQQYEREVARKVEDAGPTSPARQSVGVRASESPFRWLSSLWSSPVPPTSNGPREFETFPPR